MISNRETAIGEIQRLGLPPVFLSVWNNTVPEVLRYEWGNPSVYFEIFADLLNRVPSLSGFCPLLEQNGEAIIGIIPNGEFLRFYYEDAALENPEESIEILGQNYQQFATSILTELVDAGLWEEYEEVAGLLEFKYNRELRTILESYSDEQGEAKLNGFRDSLE